MILVYCISTNSHLAYAKVLGDSVKLHNPEYLFFTGLVDVIIPENLPALQHPIIQAEELQIPNWDLMSKDYTVFELCCALKPFFANYLLEKYPQATGIIYFDTDVKCFSHLSLIERYLNKFTIILTPHFTKDEVVSHDTELFLLRTGYFNGGFFAVTNTPKSKGFLNWWMARLAAHAYDKGELGMFVDQLWLNYVPYTFENLLICENKGLNVAQWNIKYRKIKNINNQYFVEGDINEPMLFYHFSDFRKKKEQIFSCNKEVLEDELLYKVYSKYNELVNHAKILLTTDLPCVYGKKKLFKQISGYNKVKYKIIRAATFLLKKL